MLTVICPSRGRPEAAAEAAKTFRDTAVDLDSRLVFVVDPDDDTFAQYPQDDEEPVVQTYQLRQKPDRRGMLPALNMAAGIREIVGDAVAVVGFIGDDHRFRTPGWDAAIEDYLEAHPGVAYADDMLKGADLPTMWFVSRRIVNVFGMGLPALRHLYIDNYWKTFAGTAGCLWYMPDIKIEHMHPTVGKSEWDDSYRFNNSSVAYQEDAEAYGAWVENGLERDVARLREIVAP